METWTRHAIAARAEQMLRREDKKVTGSERTFNRREPLEREKMRTCKGREIVKLIIKFQISLIKISTIKGSRPNSIL